MTVAIVISESKNVQRKVEGYAPDIRIRSNPADKLAGSIQMDIHPIEYLDGEFSRMEPSSIGTIGETIGDFVQREFLVNGKTITGWDVMMLVMQYTEVLHAEHIAASEQPAGG